MENKPLIIGITGAFGSGKSKASSFLEPWGFKKITLSSFLEEEAKKRGFKKITRKILQDIGNKFRKVYGRGILAKKALEFLKKEKISRAVIDGIRNIGEAEEFRKNNKFILIAIVADRAVRFERLKRLKRREDLTFSLFTKLDRRDLGLGQAKTGLHVAECIALSDIFIDNNCELGEFKEKLDRKIKELL